MKSKIQERTAKPSYKPISIPTATAASSPALQKLLKDIDKGKMDLGELIAAAESLKATGDVESSVALYSAWLSKTTSPLRYVALFNQAVGLAQLGRDVEAATTYSAAVALKSDFPEARVNLGLTLEKHGHPKEALEQWKAVYDQPSTPVAMLTTALNHTGRLLEETREYELAEQALTRSLAVNHNQPDALQHWVHLRQKQCKWPVYTELPGISKADMLLATSPLAMLAEADDPALQLLSAQSFAHRKLSFPEARLCEGRRYHHRRLRIGYLSSDFCVHAVGLLLAELFENQDRSQFETYGFCVSKEDGSAHRQRIIASLEHFERVGHLSDEQIARRILECEIDILVDLNGLSSGTRVAVLGYRPAPVQATWLGFIGTTALPYIDYVIADAFAIPADLASYYREKPLYLPHSFLPSDSRREVAANTDRAKHHLPADQFVFASFNNIYKLNPRMFQTWMDILLRVPNSVLWLLDDNRWATENLTKFAQSRGVDPKRLIFAGRIDPREHLARLPLADLFLDNHPYNAGSTAHDVLSKGLPMLTLSGRTFVSRMGGSLLTALGLPELIAHSHEEYIEKAVEIASKPGRATQLREHLLSAQKKASTPTAKQFAHNLERLFLKAAGREITETPSKRVKQTPNERSLLVRGWRDINHSYSLVNQFQLIELLNKKELHLSHEDLPYHSPNWSPSQNSVGFSSETSQKLSSIPAHHGEEADVVFSISSPFSLYRGPAKKVVTFMVTELGLDQSSLTPDSQNTAAFSEGRNWVVTPSHWSKKKLEIGGIAPDRIKVIPHGVDRQIFRSPTPQEREMGRSQLGLAPNDFAFLNVGGAFWNKGGDLLLRAFAEVRKKHSNAKLVIKDNRGLYGRTADQLVSMVQESHPGLLTPDVLQGVVVLPTALTMEQLRLLYGASDVYVSPYRAEGFNLPVLESMACGLKVIVTEGGATDDFFFPEVCTSVKSTFTDHTKTGLNTKGDFLEPDLEDLTNKMMAAVEAGNPSHNAISPALDAFLDTLSWEAATDKLYTFLFDSLPEEYSILPAEQPRADRSLHIYCDGGFGNRFNGLVSGLILAEAAGLRPIIVWPINNWCSAKFSDIFENTEFEVIERELLEYAPDKEKFHFFMTEDHLKLGVPFHSPLAVSTLDDAVHFLKSDSRDAYYHSPLIPGYLDWARVKPYIQKLRIQPAITGRADAFIREKGLPEPFFGIQIRKTDFGANGADDKQLFELISKGKDKTFFVCSDDKTVEQTFSRLKNVAIYEKGAYVEKRISGDWTDLTADHSGRIYPCNVHRSAESVIEAVIDLLILSRSKVVKTSNSTFLNTALLLQAARE